MCIRDSPIPVERHLHAQRLALFPHGDKEPAQRAFRCGLHHLENRGQEGCEAYCRAVVSYTHLWFIKERYKPELQKDDTSFLSGSFERHFNERPYLKHTCYLYLTKTTKERNRCLLYTSHPVELRWNHPRKRDFCRRYLTHELLRSPSKPRIHERRKEMCIRDSNICEFFIPIRTNFRNVCLVNYWVIIVWTYIITKNNETTSIRLWL